MQTSYNLPMAELAELERFLALEVRFGCVGASVIMWGPEHPRTLHLAIQEAYEEAGCKGCVFASTCQKPQGPTQASDFDRQLGRLTILAAIIQIQLTTSLLNLGLIMGLHLPLKGDSDE